jgi:2-polyprenyl-3-methyl-5-hydroxy-6-metoxy-1,4-benzoquinol methylase
VSDSDGGRLKLIDRVLRDARIARVRPYIPAGSVLLDVGCGDGELIRLLRGHVARAVGIEPRLTQRVAGDGYELVPGHFPDDVPAGLRCNVITMLAVLEHLPAQDQARLAQACSELLVPGGRLLITVPSPRVDTILHWLLRLHLIAGIAVHEHHGFEPAQVPALFPAPRYRPIAWRRFQLGLNNLFVFELV